MSCHLFKKKERIHTHIYTHTHIYHLLDIYQVLLYLHDSLQHFLWVGVKQSVNIMATSGSDFLQEGKYNRNVSDKIH